MNKPAVFFVAVPLLAPAAACVQGPVPGSEMRAKETLTASLPGHVRDGYELIWHDEFDATVLDLAKWNYRAEGSLRRLATVSRDMISLDGRETWRTSEGLSRRKQYLILSTELTGWDGDPALDAFPEAVIFDYVRAYRRKAK